MPDTSQHSPSSTTQPPPVPEPQAAGAVEPHADRPSRLVRFGRKHPALTVVGLASAGLLAGVEMAAGVLLGAGVAALIRRPNGEAPSAPFAETRGRMRRMLEHTPHDLRERARAVLLAARGKIPPPPEVERAGAAPKSEVGAAQDAQG